MRVCGGARRRRRQPADIQALHAVHAASRMHLIYDMASCNSGQLDRQEAHLRIFGAQLASCAALDGGIDL
jgi:hypothetical protein